MNENAIILSLYVNSITVNCYISLKFFNLTSVVCLSSKGQEKYSRPSKRLSCVWRRRDRKNSPVPVNVCGACGVLGTGKIFPSQLTSVVRVPS